MFSAKSVISRNGEPISLSSAATTDAIAQPPRRVAAPLSASLTASNREKINDAFDSGVANDDAEEEPSVRPASKRRRINVVVDDEEDELLNGEDVGPGGFTMGDTEMGGGGGGFVVEEEAGGGGFVVEDSEMGGGFMPEDDGAAGEGGFLAGGFDAQRSPSPIYVKPKAPVNPFALLPLSNVPSTLGKLRLRPGALTQLMNLFRGVSEKNIEEEDCISRQNFVEGCAVMILDDDGSDDELEQDEEGEEEEGYEPEEAVSTSKKAPSRATRSNPAPLQRLVNDVKGKGKARQVEAVASDLDELASSDESADGTATTTSRSATKTSGKSSPAVATTKGKGRAKKVKDRNRELTSAELEQAKETFDLFFEDSDQLWQETQDRTIGMKEMRRVAGFLGEKIKDDEVRTSQLRNFATWSV